MDFEPVWGLVGESACDEGAFLPQMPPMINYNLKLMFTIRSFIAFVAVAALVWF